MQIPQFDPRARKRTVSVTINSDLFEKVRTAGINASRVAEQALAGALHARYREQLRAEFRQDSQALAEYVAKYGDPAA